MGIESFNKRTVLILISIIIAIIAFVVFLRIFGVFTSTKNSSNFSKINIEKPQNNEQTVNIAFSTDKTYKNYLQVAILSAIINKNPESYYNIYVLGINLSKKDIKNLKNLVQYTNADKVKITVIPLKLSMLDSRLKRKFNLHYVSRADFFKIFLPEIFINFDKILYLDSDILVLNDLKDLYNTNLEDKYLGAVKRFDSSPKTKQDFYNCGVMLYNLEKWRKDDISNKIANIKNNNKKDTTLTQYPINRAIKPENVVLLSPIYNNVVWPEEDFDIQRYKKNYSSLADSIKDYKDLSKKTVIAHFTGIKKPWHNPDIEFGDKWWHYAHIINPKWQKEKRNKIKYLINCVAIMTKFVDTDNKQKIWKNFYDVYNYNL